MRFEFGSPGGEAGGQTAYAHNGYKINRKWLEAGGIDSVMEELPDKKIKVKEFNTSAEEIAVRKSGEEIKSQRTANTQVFKGSKSGEFTAKIYAGNKYYFDEDSLEYEEINTSVKEISSLAKSNPLRKHDKFVDAGNYKATWFDGKPWNYKFFVGDSWIEYEALFEQSDVVTIKIETSNIGVKEIITLKDNTAPSEFSWRVTREGDGIITPPPTAEDANGKNVPVVSNQVGDILTYEVNTAGAVYPIELDPTTSVTVTNDGRVYANNATYTTARNANAGTADGSIQIGQTTGYYVIRSFFSFAIPNMATLTTASLFLYGYSDDSTTDFAIYLHTSNYSNPLVGEDFDQLDGWRASGTYVGTILNNSWNSSSYSTTWNQIDFNADGLTAILAKKNSIFKMVAISNEDYISSQPTQPENVWFLNSANTGKEPYLSITFTLQADGTVCTANADCTSNNCALDDGESNKYCATAGYCGRSGTAGYTVGSNGVTVTHNECQGGATSGTTSWLCDGGYYTSGSCTATTAGYYSGEDSDSQTACPAGTYGTGGSTTSACTGQCLAGYYGSNTARTTSSCDGLCAAGRYGSTTGLTTNQCTGACLAGYYEIGRAHV